MLTKELTEKIQCMVALEPSKLPTAIAEELGLSEAQVVFSLSNEMVTKIAASETEEILTELVSSGKVTTIIHSENSIFEVKATFPKGKIAHGYYNLMGKEGQLHGHLRIDLITDIALVSKPFMNMESYYFGFFTKEGNSMFKIYLGRDKKRKLIAEQVESFKQLKAQYQEVSA